MGTLVSFLALLSVSSLPNSLPTHVSSVAPSLLQVRFFFQNSYRIGVYGYKTESQSSPGIAYPKFHARVDLDGNVRKTNCKDVYLQINTEPDE